MCRPKIYFPIWNPGRDLFFFFRSHPQNFQHFLPIFPKILRRELFFFFSSHPQNFQHFFVQFSQRFTTKPFSRKLVSKMSKKKNLPISPKFHDESFFFFLANTPKNFKIAAPYIYVFCFANFFLYVKNQNLPPPIMCRPGRTAPSAPP